jgi:SulP family sulfate permease
LLLGFTEIIFAVSLGSLIFSGELTPYRPYGIGIAIASLAITSITISLTTSVPSIATCVQDSSSVIQGLIVAGLYGALSTFGESDRLNMVLAVLALTSLLTGLFFLVLGFFNLGGMVRYVPYPVVGGFLAGTGWLLVQASISVMTDLPLTLSNIPQLIHPDQLLLWLPGTILALMLVFSLKKFNHFLTLPGILIGAIIIFYIALLVSGTTIEGAIQRGLLLGEFSDEAAWQPFRIRSLTAASWIATFSQSGNIATIFILSVLNLLLNATGLELALKRDIDINHELKAAGIANVLSGLGGGMIGFQTLSLSTLGYRLKVRGRLSGLVAGVIPIIILFAGTTMLAFFPKLIVGGLLLFLGLDFLYEWLITGWSKLSRMDYGIVVLILVVIQITAGLMSFITCYPERKCGVMLNDLIINGTTFWN